MIDKIKAYLQSNVTTIVTFIVAPIVTIIFLIIKSLAKVKDLKEDLAISKNEVALADAMQKRKEADEKANSSQNDYLTLRDLYIKQQKHDGAGTPTESDT